MFIHEISDIECRRSLQSATIGRLACARDNQPYVVPIHFAFADSYLYGFTTVGQKTEWMRSNPLVCFELDEVNSDNQWLSIVVFGRYEELPDTPEFQCARIHAHELLQKRAMWWEPAYISQAHRDQPHSLAPIFYRIHINKMTGHRATAHNGQVTRSDVAVSEAKRGWLSKLLHPQFKDSLFSFRQQATMTREPS
ncbi:MAG TPA: pyridoxamine 5'-phosphate oxidase family protein [Pyrinomonadaceae bacterium]|nr:pyridoxamine 5'-phosphate oxidase family protein [Pyrinomonadaceae bacterium]